MNETPKNYVPAITLLVMALGVFIIVQLVPDSIQTEEPAIRAGDVVYYEKSVEIDYKVFSLSSDCRLLNMKGKLPNHMIELCNKAHKRADEYHIILDKLRVPELETELKQRFK